MSLPPTDARFVFFALASLLLAGCATNPQPAFDDVNTLILERANQGLQWNGAINRDPEIAQQLEALLQKELTVTSAVQIAFLNNRSLQAALEEVGISYAEYFEASLLPNPKFSGSVGFPLEPPSSTSIGLSLVQNILQLLTQPLRKKIAATQLEQTKLRVVSELIESIAEVKNAFYSVQGHYQLLDRLKIIKEVNETAAEFAQRLHAAGNITDLDLLTHQAAYTQSRANMAEKEADLVSDRERLNRLLGLWGSNTDWKIVKMLPAIPKEELPVKSLESLAIAHRLDLAAARSSILALTGALGISKTYRYVGTFEFGVDMGRDTDGQITVGPSVGLEIPIFNQGQGKIALLQAKLRQAERRYEAKAVNIRSEVRESRDKLAAKRKIALFYQETLLPERLKIVNLTQMQVNAMQADPFKLLQAKQNEIEAERDYVAALRDYWIAAAELDKAVGGSLILKQARPHPPDAIPENKSSH